MVRAAFLIPSARRIAYVHVRASQVCRRDRGCVILGLTLANVDVTTLVPDASLEGDVVLVRPHTARLP